MGPVAGVAIHSALVDAVSRLEEVQYDNQYPDVVHVSFSTEFQDVGPWIIENQSAASTEAVGGRPVNPGKACANLVRRMAFPSAAVEGGRRRHILLGVCCNTFHAKPTWDAFLQALRQPWDANRVEVEVWGADVGEAERVVSAPASSEDRVCVSVVDMPALTVAGLPRSINRVGVLCSDATRDLGIYEEACTKAGRTFVGISDAMQQDVTAAIYATKQHGSSIPPDISNKLLDVARHLVDVEGVQVIVFGKSGGGGGGGERVGGKKGGLGKGGTKF
jgi:hypothetical protein